MPNPKSQNRFIKIRGSEGVRMRKVIPAALALVASLAGPLGAQQQPSAPAPAGQEAGARGRGGRGTPPGLEPRIVSFEARPATVRAGDPVQLVWATENPAGGVTIDQEIGAVNARGSRTVTPAATTTYTLAMRGGPSRSITVTVQGTAAPRRGPSGSGTGDAVPRMPDGRPDLTGVYGSAGLPAGTTPPPVKAGAEKFRIV